MPQLHTTATLDPDTGQLAIFAVNRSRTEPCELTLDLAALTSPAVGGQDLARNGTPAAYAIAEHLVIHDDDPSAHNSESAPDRIVPHAGGATIDGTTLRAVLPPISWHVIRLTEGKLT